METEQEIQQSAQKTAEGLEKVTVPEAETAIADSGEGGQSTAEKDGLNADFEEGSNAGGDGRTGKEQSDETRERNRQMAAKRREKELAEKVAAAKLEGAISAIGKNPWTNEPLKTKSDLNDYYRMKAVADAGGDPLGADYVKAIREEQKSAERKAEEEKAREDFVRKDRESFSEAYPDVEISELFGDGFFKDYADGKLGVKPLKDIYEGYRRLTAGYEKQAKEKAAAIVANAKATPGAVSGQGTVETDVYTLEQLRNLDRDAADKNREKWERSLKYHHIN